MMEPSRPPPALAARLPHAPGVYRFRDAAGKALYLGRAASLRRRVVSYWGDLGGRAHLAVMVGRIARVEAVVCDSAHEAALAGAEPAAAAPPAVEPQRERWPGVRGLDQAERIGQRELPAPLHPSCK